MASSKDYRKPRNQELRDLLTHLPHPVRVSDSMGKILWQNRAAETLEGETRWVGQPATWQNKLAVLHVLDTSDVQVSERETALEEDLGRVRRHQKQTARRKKKAEDTAKQREREVEAASKREQKLRQQLESERTKAQALESQFSDFRRQTEEAESHRQIEEQLAAKVREFEELEKAFDDEQKAFVEQKRELEERISEQEGEFGRLKEKLQPSAEQVSGEAPSSEFVEELKSDLEEAKRSFSESTRREVRLTEQLESLNDLKNEQSKMLGLLKAELKEVRDREQDLKETLKIQADLREQLDRVQTDSKRHQAEREELEKSAEALKMRLVESREELFQVREKFQSSSATLTAEPASGTVKSQLDLAQSRLRETEKQLDAVRGALKKAESDAVSSKDTEKLAFQDSLTGLPNRHIVDRYLDYSFKQAQSYQRAVAIFLIDVDGFRVLNETFGRDWGDVLLKAVGERLAGMRGSNHVFARQSQDRFILLAANLERATTQKFVRDASQSLLDALAYPFDIRGESISLTGSIGIALGVGSPKETPPLLIRQAETALEQAKAKGIGQYYVHDEALGQKAQRDATYLRQMEQAVERGEFQAVYQPVFHLGKGQVMGLELLLRWNHRDQRTLRPDEFLAVATRSGLIVPLTEKIWTGAFRALARWRKRRAGVTLSINLSDRELLSPNLAQRILGLAESAGVEPNSLIFEVRDQSRLRISSGWWAILGKLHEAGFGLCLDDYGSDGSFFGTLGYQGFTQAKVTVDERNPLVTPSLAAGKRVLYGAKRLQTKFDPKALKKAGFDLAQGFAVAQPIDEDDVDGVLS